MFLVQCGHGRGELTTAGLTEYSVISVLPCPWWRSTAAVPVNFRVTDNAGEGIWVGSGAQMTLEGVNLTVTGNGSNGLAVC